MTDDSPGPEIPPGIRLHLEAGDNRLRELGVMDDLIDQVVETSYVTLRVNHFLYETIVKAHRTDGWSARRRLKKDLRFGIIPHLQSCRSCRTLALKMRQGIDGYLSMCDETAPK